MNVDFKGFAAKVAAKEKSGEWDRQKCFRARNLLSTIARPQCPAKLVQAYSRVLNDMFGEKVVET